MKQKFNFKKQNIEVYEKSKSYQGSSSIVKLYIDEKIDLIKRNEFKGCARLEEAVIEEGTVNQIEDYAFAGCENLMNVVIPKSVSKIGNNAFIWTNANLCIYCEKDSYAENFAKRRGISYKHIGGYLGFGKYRYDGKTSFRNNQNAEMIEVSGNISTIYANTFAGCINLKEIEIPNSVTKIEEGAFKDCAPDFTIYCDKGFYVEAYARVRGIKYKYFDDDRKILSPIVKSDEEIDYKNKLLEIKKNNAGYKAVIESLETQDKEYIIYQLVNTLRAAMDANYENMDLEEKNKDLEEELIRVSAESKSLQEENIKLQEVNEKLYKEIKNRQGDNKRLQGIEKKLQEENRRFQLKDKELQEENRRLQVEIRVLKNQLKVSKKDDKKEIFSYSKINIIKNMASRGIDLNLIAVEFNCSVDDIKAALSK